MYTYVRLAGFLAQNLFHRVADDLADCAVVVKRGFLYKMRSLRERYDDVGPDEGDDDFVALPEDLTQLGEYCLRFLASLAIPLCFSSLLISFVCPHFQELISKPVLASNVSSAFRHLISFFVYNLMFSLAVCVLTALPDGHR